MDLPASVVNRGGEYCFIGLRGLHWISELNTQADMVGCC
jgi:hypothetical protein